MKLGVFDHIDRNALPLGEQYEQRQQANRPERDFHRSPPLGVQFLAA